MEVNEKKLKEVLKDQREEYQRYLKVVAENFSSQVKVIGEQYGSIQERLNEHTEMIGSIMENMEVIKSDVEIIKNSLKKKVDLEEFAMLEKRVIILENKLSRSRS